VKAYDINNPNNVATSTVQVSVDTIIQCTPNSVVAEGRFLKKCRSDGGGWDVIQTCPEGQVADPISQGCKAGGGSDGGSCFLGLCNLKLPDIFGGIIGAIIMVLFVIVIVIIIVIIYKLVRWARR
jgi:hypothetical protein